MPPGCLPNLRWPGLMRVMTWCFRPLCLVPLFSAACLDMTALDDPQTPAFPGATGFGRYANGWRGGEVVKVTNLADNGSGSLRACAEDRSSPRICVFDISGTIEFDRPIFVAPNTYIAGQTAPAQGIQLKLGTAEQSGPIIIKNSHDVVVRFLKLRPGASLRPSSSISGVLVMDSHDVYLDHLSVQFATDQNVSVHTDKFPTKDITIERSIVAWGLDHNNHPKGRHSKGALICSTEGPTGVCGRISLIENLFAHNRDRNPDVKATSIGPVEVINNVFYNPISQFGEFYNLIGDTRINYIGNIGLAGPSTRTIRRPAAVEAFGWNLDFALEIFADDNLNLDRRRCNSDKRLDVVDQKAKGYLVAKPNMPLMHRPLPVADTFEHVLTSAGARLPDGSFLDHLDAALIAEVRNCQGSVIDSPDEVGGWPELPVARSSQDSDQDGMPDTWERTHVGLNPDDESDVWADRDGDGWSNIEEYLSTLAGDFLVDPNRNTSNITPDR